MCGSRKYPYPTTEGISLRTPPPPWIFHIYNELVIPHPPPPTSAEFPQSKTKPPPAPLEKFIFTKKKIIKVKNYAICSYAMVFILFY